MAEEGNEGGATRMDLNLYLGLPRSSRSRVLDLGSDLALGSISLPASSSTEESCAAPMDDGFGSGSGSGGMSEPSVAHSPYSPSRASFAPGLPSLMASFVPVHLHYRPPYDSMDASYIPISDIAMDESPERAADEEPYSPMDEEEGEEHVGQDGIPHLPYELASPPPLVPYSPQGATLPSSPPRHGLLPPDSDDFMAGHDGSSSRQNPLHHRLRRIIELNNRTRLRRFRSSLSYGSQRPLVPPVPEQVLQETAGKNKAASGRLVSESSDGESEEKRSAADFECNVCLELAKEPVVTSCGHLFCWPCLYQWLNIHSEHKECPVCKGEVVESNITPIYGRGGGDNEKVASAAHGAEDSNLKIPPRPRGNRFESFRQQLRYRRIGEGIVPPWRIEERIRSRTRFEGQTVQDMLDLSHRRVFTRLRGLRFQREDDALLEGVSHNDLLGPAPAQAVGSLDPQNSNSGPGFREDALRRLSVNGPSSPANRLAALTNERLAALTNERLAALTTDLSRAERLVSRHSRYGGLAFVPNNSYPPPERQQPDGREVASAAALAAAEQASASSTMAVIEGDAPVPNPLADPNRAGPSRNLRVRGRSSLDVDGCGVTRKRRRLN